MKMMKILGCVMMILISTLNFAQKIDEQRMERDIEVAENVLSTLLRQQFDKQKMFFPLEVKGSYQPGYGVTFRLPADFTTPIVFSFDGPGEDMHWDVPQAPGVYSYSYKVDEDGEHMEEIESMEPIEPVEPIERPEKREMIDKGDHHRIVIKSNVDVQRDKADKEREKADKDRTKADKEREKADKLKDKAEKQRDKLKERKRADMDSIRDVYNDKMIEASKNFLADYGDLISQLSPEEKIIITNQGEQPRMWVGKLVNAPKRTHLSIEAAKGDLSAYKQGKLTHDQIVSKIKVVNTETVETIEPDLELLSSIFDRLYQPDLSHTYFTEDRIYYERLKDYGVVYYMQVYSSNQQDYMLFSMPTIKLNDVDQATRNKKVTELYPDFEKELKENILEYGRTLKSLKDTEVLVFNVKLTKCASCGIPSSLELSVKGSVLKDFGLGKIDKNSAVSKLMVKKGPNQ